MNDEELESKLDQLIKCQTKSDHSLRDTCITKQQFLSYLATRDKSRDQQIALVARIDELELINADCGERQPRFYQWSAYINGISNHSLGRLATLKTQEKEDD
jgi:hypothetical protein